MKRWTQRILVFLLLGAIVNVAVAWGCALWPQTPSLEYLSSEDRDLLLKQCPPDYLSDSGWRANAVGYSLICLGDGHVRDHEDRVMLGLLDDPTREFTIIQTGLPFHSLQSKDEVRILTFFAVGTVQEGLWDALPHEVLIGGFAINTLFYAAVVWLLFLAPFQFRRWRRIKRGLCPKCAYDQRGSVSPTCPECGAAPTCPTRRDTPHRGR
jgi:hypothetical protein